MDIKNRLPRPAMIVACLALIAALGGTAFAASKINGKQIKKDSITGKQIKEKTLKGVKSAKKAKKAKTAKKLNGETNADLKTRWLLVNGAGQITEQSGGFTILDAYQTNSNVYIDAGEATANHGFVAAISTVNKGDVYSPTGVVDANFNGEVSVARCQTDAVECAPTNSKNTNAFVIAPRNSDGSTTNANTRKAVYVVMTEDTSASMSGSGR